MSKIELEQVEEVASLARLELSASEKEKFGKEISGILDYFDVLNKVKTDKVEPTAQVTGLSDIVRADEKKPSEISQADILSNAPEKKDGYIKVKPVL